MDNMLSDYMSLLDLHRESEAQAKAAFLKQTQMSSQQRQLPCSLLQSMSRREKRWANDRHMGLLTPDLSIEEWIQHKSMPGHNFDLNHHPTFFSGQKHQHCSALKEAFRSCKETGNKNGDHYNSHRGMTSSSENDLMALKFSKLSAHKRKVLSHGVLRYGSFLQRAEDLVMHFITWNELPCRLEVQLSTKENDMILGAYLEKKNGSCNNNTCDSLIFPMDHSYLRLLTHCVCEFHDLSSQTISIVGKGKGIQIEKKQLDSLEDANEEYLTMSSLCDFIYTHRLSVQKQMVCSTSFHDIHGHRMTLDSDDSDGFQVIPENGF